MRCFIIGMILMAISTAVNAEIYYKDIPKAADSTTQVEKPKNMVECKKGNEMNCRTSSKQTKFIAFGECKLVSSTDGKGLFIPARSKKEWGGFMSWADAHPDKVTVDNCEAPQWSEWTQCSTACGKGVHTRQCMLGTKGGKLLCKGPDQGPCQDYSGCECGALQNRTQFCPGQDKNFFALPPAVTYVDFDKCDGRAKCQARCLQGSKALADGSACQ